MFSTCLNPNTIDADTYSKLTASFFSSSGALDITEDVGIAVAGAPNLAKLWHHAYQKELAHEERNKLQHSAAHNGDINCIHSLLVTDSFDVFWHTRKKIIANSPIR